MITMYVKRHIGKAISLAHEPKELVPRSERLLDNHRPVVRPHSRFFDNRLVFKPVSFLDLSVEACGPAGAEVGLADTQS